VNALPIYETELMAKDDRHILSHRVHSCDEQAASESTEWMFAREGTQSLKGQFWVKTVLEILEIQTITWRHDRGIQNYTRYV